MAMILDSYTRKVGMYIDTVTLPAVRRSFLFYSFFLFPRSLSIHEHAGQRYRAGDATCLVGSSIPRCTQYRLLLTDRLVPVLPITAGEQGHKAANRQAG